MGKLTAKQRLAECDRRMGEHMAEMARSWGAMGEICNEVDRQELYREGGFASVFEWATSRHKTSRRTIEKAMAVAVHFNAEMAERHGTEKLAATVDYLRANRRDEPRKRDGVCDRIVAPVPDAVGIDLGERHVYEFPVVFLHVSPVTGPSGGGQQIGDPILNLSYDAGLQRRRPSPGSVQWSSGPKAGAERDDIAGPHSRATWVRRGGGAAEPGGRGRATRPALSGRHRNRSRMSAPGVPSSSSGSAATARADPI